jgi:hypothetical protein
MRVGLIVIILTSLTASVLAWSVQDREIFALREDVEKDLGKGATFYDFLEISRSATDADVAKAYRKLSRKIHPDKDPSKSATERFARLGLVANVLRSDGRERYDFFLDKGFPRWKGTDYYYSRYRPGLGTVIFFLYFFISVSQYVLMSLSAHRHRSHMSGIIGEARSLAWTTPGLGPGVKRRVTLENGKIFAVYPEGNVFLIHNDSEYLVDVDEIKNPRWKDTLLVKLPQWIVYQVTGKRIGNDLVQLDGRVSGTTDDGKKKDNKKKLKPTPAAKVGAVRRRH